MVAPHREQAKAFLHKANEYLDSAQDNLDLERFTPAAGDAIHAGIDAKDAIVTSLTAVTIKAKDHALAAKELRTALASRTEAASAERALRELSGAKSSVEYGTRLVDSTQATALVRRARSLVELATKIVRLGG